MLPSQKSWSDGQTIGYLIEDARGVPEGRQASSTFGKPLNFISKMGRSEGE
jgi:hypothetical protein